MDKNMQQQPNNQIETESKGKLQTWFKRLGLAGFLFFLIKGIVWLFVLFGVGKCLQ